MLGKNNFSGKLQSSLDKQRTFAIRKLSIGVVSIASAFVFMGTSANAQTVETTTAPTTAEQTVAETTAAPVEETTVNPVVEEAINNVGNDETLKQVDINIVEDETYGDTALDHVEYLSENIGKRVVGTEGEARAKQYILDKFTEYGYKPELEEFTYTNKAGDVITTHNIIADKKGESDKVVVVGAHYDSVPQNDGLGADDNASSVGIMLETAKRLFDATTPYSIRFISFGAEEVGKKGSEAYVAGLSKDELKNIVGMFNMDSLIAGDKMYIHAGANTPVWFRDQAFDIARAMGHDNLEPNPGLNEHYPMGTTGEWSDHDAFDRAGIPIAYFEGSNWEIADLDGYSQTEKFGPIWHTDYDTLEFLNKEYPGRVEDRLNTFSGTLYNLLTNMVAPEDVEEVKEAQAKEKADAIAAEDLVIVDKKIGGSDKEAVETLPETGETSSVALNVLASLSLLSGGYVLTRKK